MIAASEPQREGGGAHVSQPVDQRARRLRGRAALPRLADASEWKLPFALAVTVLVSSYVVRIQTMWRQAPITAAIVIASGLTHHSKLSGVEHGLHKVAEVIFGCLMGLARSAGLMSKVWPLREPAKSATA